MGRLWRQNIADGLPGFSYALWDKWLGRSKEQIDVSFFVFFWFYTSSFLRWPRSFANQSFLFLFLDIQVELVGVRKALANNKVRAYERFYVVWGRKPGI